MRLLKVFSALTAVLCLSMHPLVQAQSSDESVIGEITRACPPPEMPSIPNGKQASKEEMLAAQKNVKAYIASGDEFLACQESVEARWSEEELPSKKPISNMLHNKVVDNMTEVADLFNSALQAYKGRNNR